MPNHFFESVELSKTENDILVGLLSNDVMIHYLHLLADSIARQKASATIPKNNPTAVEDYVREQLIYQGQLEAIDTLLSYAQIATAYQPQEN